MYELHLINAKPLKKIDLFKKNKKFSILNNLQNDILTCKKMKRQEKKRYLSSQDNSISINICYNKRHEIEILHEKLLVFLNENTNIQPKDIVITSVVIDDYIPYINSIFKSTKNKKYIPFFISSTHSNTTKIIFSSFNKILNLSNSRFNNDEILELLDIPEIAKRFNISEDEIDVLYNWVETSNIRWAFDKTHKKDLGMPENNQNTWLYGIKKLILSYAMNDTKNIWNDILSCTLINSSRAELIGKLSEFIHTLNKWRKKLLKPQHLKYWYSLSESLINDFFYKGNNINKTLEIIHIQWIKMVNDHMASDYKKKISITVLKKNFFYIFQYINTKKFLPGMVNFCHPESICYIPFKIICIIGADYKSIPKEKNIDNFNLLNTYSSIGDVNMYQKNCYLFLQSISCAQKFFYISYVGYSIKNDTKIYPSILVDQLFNYISYNFCFKNDYDLDLEKNKKKMFTHFFKTHKKESFYIKYTIIKNHQNTLPTKILSYNKNINYEQELIKNFYNTINIKELIYFWKNPIRYFCNFQLKIKFDLKQKNINITEPFLVSKLDRFKINSLLLKQIINNQDIDKLLKHYTLSGLLPYGFFRKIFLKQQVKEMKKIAQLVIQYRINPQEKKFNLTIKKYQLFGTLSEIQNTGLLRWKPNIINHNDRISLWLEHLIYSALGGIGESKMIGYKNKIWSFSPLSSDAAYNYLEHYIMGYIEGIQNPLFLIKSGAVWVDQIYDIKNNCIQSNNQIRKKGYKKLLNTWIGNNFYQGEKEDFYIQKIITQLNFNNIKKICKTAEKWLIPILKNKKNH